MLNLIRGAVAGAVATWVMDLTTEGFQASQSPESLVQEADARPNGQSAVENLVERIQERTGMAIPDRLRPFALRAVHFSLGAVPGALYAALRHRVPLLGAGGGLVYGAILWAVNDEYLNTALGLAGPYEAYPAMTHARGLVGHLVLGGATDSLIDVLGG